jgi:hypothetical protein
MATTLVIALSGGAAGERTRAHAAYAWLDGVSVFCF